MAQTCYERYRPRVVDDRPQDNPLFLVRDYEGVGVVCTIERWVTKVLQQHPELVDRRQGMVDAIERPQIVLRDRDHSSRKHHMIRTATGQWLKVVVDYEPDPLTGEQRGTVVTAFLHHRMRRGDSVLYTRSGN